MTETMAVPSVPNMRVGRGGSKREFLGAVFHAQGVSAKMIRAAGYIVPPAAEPQAPPMRCPQNAQRPRRRRAGRGHTQARAPDDDPHPQPPSPLVAADGRVTADRDTVRALLAPWLPPRETTVVQRILTHAYAQQPNARELFEAAAILQHRGDELTGGGR